MVEITVDAPVVGTGPAGSSAADPLASRGVGTMVIDRRRWPVNTPRAHITVRRAMAMLRDPGCEDEGGREHLLATEQDVTGENVLCESLASEEMGQMNGCSSPP